MNMKLLQFALFIVHQLQNAIFKYNIFYGQIGLKKARDFLGEKRGHFLLIVILMKIFGKFLSSEFLLVSLAGAC